MGRARARVVVAGPIAEAEALWYDLRRWASFVEGFATVVRVDGEWPHSGARLTWDSIRAGRGRVVERVVEHEPRVGQTVQVDDPKLRGTQRVAFAVADAELVEVSLELEYALKSGGAAGRVVDALFVRRALTDSLRRTLIRFARELEAEREQSG
jgi:uncharacterized membrane protein